MKLKAECLYRDCAKPEWTRGYCPRHYYALLRSGELPLARIKKRRSLEEIFRASYEINPVTGCWDWTGWVHKKGYAYIHDYAQRKFRANRVSYEMHHGNLPAQAMVLHTCDNRRCVNPDHLYLGNALLNMRDCIARGRDTQHVTGWQRKLTDAMAVNARVMSARGNHSMQQLAEIYQVDQQTIRNLLHGRTYF